MTAFLQAPDEVVDSDMTAKERPSKRGIGQATAAPESQTEQWKRDLVIALATYEALRRTRLHDAMLCDYLKMSFNAISIGMVHVTEAWVAATIKDPASHGLGPLFPHPYKQLAERTIKVIDHEGNAKLKAEIDPQQLNTLREHVKMLTGAESTHETVTHCTAKVSYNEQFHVVELSYTAHPQAQLIRQIQMKTLAFLGAERMVGPPPPGEAERDLKALITDLKSKLNISKKTKKKAADKA